MSTKRMLADVLWEAANKHLSPGYMCWDDHAGVRFLDRWSCNAALMAEMPTKVTAIRDRVGLKSLRAASTTWKFLANLGCPVNSDTAFDNLDDMQGARYMWLLLAMHVAEDEGITV